MHNFRCHSRPLLYSATPRSTNRNQSSHTDIYLQIYCHPQGFTQSFGRKSPDTPTAHGSRNASRRRHRSTTAVYTHPIPPSLSTRPSCRLHSARKLQSSDHTQLGDHLHGCLERGDEDMSLRSELAGLCCPVVDEWEEVGWDIVWEQGGYQVWVRPFRRGR